MIKANTTKQDGYCDYERNDCVVRALTEAALIPYEKAHAALTGAGRKPRCGMYEMDYMPVFKSMLKLKEIRFDSPLIGIPLSKFFREEKTLVEENILIIKISGHIFTSFGGEIKDWIDMTRRHRIQKIWIVQGNKGKYDKKIAQLIRKGRDKLSKYTPPKPKTSWLG